MTQPAPADQTSDSGIEQLDAQPVNAPQHREF